MRCSNCGKDVPFKGRVIYYQRAADHPAQRVGIMHEFGHLMTDARNPSDLLVRECPWCHVDKTKDQMVTMLSVLFGLGGGALGGFTLGFWGGVVGFVGGIVSAVIVGSKAAKRAEEQRRLK